jgi:hypothetical protein
MLKENPPKDERIKTIKIKDKDKRMDKKDKDKKDGDKIRIRKGREDDKDKDKMGIIKMINPKIRRKPKPQPGEFLQRLENLLDARE